MSYRTSGIAKTFRKICFYMQLNCARSPENIRKLFWKKNFFNVKSWFSGKPSHLASISRKDPDIRIQHGPITYSQLCFNWKTIFKLVDLPR